MTSAENKNKRPSRTKGTEELLRRSEEMYRGLFENMLEPVFLRRLIYDERGEIVDRVLINANPAGLKVLGVGTIDEVMDKRIANYTTQNSRPSGSKLQEKLRPRGNPLPWNYTSTVIIGTI